MSVLRIELRCSRLHGKFFIYSNISPSTVDLWYWISMCSWDCYVAQAILKRKTFVFQPPGSWDNRPATATMTNFDVAHLKNSIMLPQNSLLKNAMYWGQRDGLALKSNCYTCRGSRFSSQHCMAVRDHLYITPVPGLRCPRHQAQLCYAYTWMFYIGKTHKQTKTNRSLKSLCTSYPQRRNMKYEKQQGCRMLSR